MAELESRRLAARALGRDAAVVLAALSGLIKPPHHPARVLCVVLFLPCEAVRWCRATLNRRDQPVRKKALLGKNEEGARKGKGTQSLTAGKQENPSSQIFVE